MEIYDVVILGMGPGGLTAGIYAARYNLKTLILGEMPGGMLAEAYEICNFPSYDKIGGMELMDRMEKHATGLGVEVRMDTVTDIGGKDMDFTIRGGRGEYRAKKIILATGTVRVKLGLPGEEKLAGRGISYCATCDAAFYKGKTVGVVGGGNSALSSALLLSEYADTVYIIYRRERFFRPEPVRINEAEQRENIKVLFNTQVTELMGNERLEAVKLRDPQGDSKLELNGLFVEMGATPRSSLGEKLGVALDEKGYIVTEPERRTTVRGVYAAGDVIDSPLKQGITAAGQGAEAAASVFEDLNLISN